MEKNIAKIIAEKREERNMTLDDLSKMTGLSKSYLSRIEKGERTSPSAAAVEKIYKAFNMKYTESDIDENLESLISNLKETLILYNRKGDISLTETIGVMEQVNTIIKFRG